MTKKLTPALRQVKALTFDVFGIVVEMVAPLHAHDVKSSFS